MLFCTFPALSIYSRVNTLESLVLKNKQGLGLGEQRQALLC
jgi:hypothetical protein